jgi:hypothetical protein
MDYKVEAGQRLANVLEQLNISTVGQDGEFVCLPEDQVKVANALEKAGFSMVLVSDKNTDKHGAANLYKLAAQPRSITEIISAVTPENSDMIAEKIKVDPVLRAVQMNMIAFD